MQIRPVLGLEFDDDGRPVFWQHPHRLAMLTLERFCTHFDLNLSFRSLPSREYLRTLALVRHSPVDAKIGSDGAQLFWTVGDTCEILPVVDTAMADSADRRLVESDVTQEVFESKVPVQPTTPSERQ